MLGRTRVPAEAGSGCHGDAPEAEAGGVAPTNTQQEVALLTRGSDRGLSRQVLMK